MKLKNIIKLKEGYRAGFDLTDTDFSHIKGTVKRSYISLNHISLEVKLLELLYERVSPQENEVVLTEVKKMIYIAGMLTLTFSLKEHI